MRIFKKLLQFLITGSFSFIIAACYGAPVEYSGVQTKLRVVNKDGQPVKGLMINIGGDFYPEYYYTDEKGEAVFYPMIDEMDVLYNPIIKDLDGEENLGCFAKTEAVLGEEAELEVVIKENENSYSDTEKTIKFVTANIEPISGLKVKLSDEGCNQDEFTTNENGEITFYPLVNKEGVMYNISVIDEDWTASLGYFEEKEVVLTDEIKMTVVMAMIEAEPVVEPAVEPEQQLPKNQQKLEDGKSK